MTNFIPQNFIGNHFGQGRYHANESFNEKSSVDDHALVSYDPFFFDWCLHRATCSSWCQLVFSVGQVVFALVSEPAVAMQVVVSERLS